jgi:predicted ATPase/DNA-binding SARP family transcriptional activator/Tfp pilus assembly protein PilF
MLGTLRVRQDEREITCFRTHNGAALLAYLAYHIRRAHPREVLAELLWPWAPPVSGRTNLRAELAALRRQLEPPGVPTGAVIRANRFRIELNPEAVSTDVAEFEGALAEAVKARSDTARLDRLMAALALYAGPLLPGHYQDWVVAEQDRLAERHFEATESVVRILQSGGELGEALRHARRAVAVDPLREAAHVLVMRLLAEMGQSGAAHRQYRELERILRDELDEAPSEAARSWVDGLPEALARREGQATKPARARRTPARPGADVLGPGVVTLLLCGIDEPAASRDGQRGREPGAISRDILWAEVRRHGGRAVPAQPPELVAAFARATDALAGAVAAQQAMRRLPGPGAGAPVRMVLHTCEIESGGDHLCGEALRYASRLLEAGHPGQILCGEATCALLRQHPDPSGLLTDLGSYRLGAAAELGRVFQAGYPGMEPRGFPPLRAQASQDPSLPLTFTTFFGRTEELGQLLGTVVPGATRVVTLTGPGGGGKTRLAVEVARRVADAFHGAVWFVPLNDLGDANALPRAITDALGLPRTAHGDPQRQAADLLARQPSLLVLDGIEHIVPGAAPVLETLLGRAPALTCLATSRHRLGLAAETELHVGPLPTPGDDDVSGLARNPAVQLFVDRAQAARPDFQLTVTNARSIAEVCRRLDGIPLAIELAAAWALVLSPARMLAQLEDRFRFLVSRRRPASERHRTLRAAVDWSYQLLSPPLRRLLAQLSVFRGGWTIEAVEVVCEEPDALEAMFELRECSIVHCREQPGQMRYDMLETFRDFAAELLEPEAAEALRARHAVYLLTFAESRAEKADGSDEALAFGELEVELGNLGAAVDWAATSGQHQLAARLAAALSDFLWRRGYWEEHVRWMGAGVAASPTSTPEDRTLAARLWHSLARVAYDRGDLDGAERDCRAGLDLVTGGGRGHWHAMLVNVLGLAASRRGQHEEAERLLQQSLALFREVGHSRGEGMALHNLGVLAYATGQPDGARALYEQALPIRQASDDVRGVAETQNNLGVLAYESGELGPAEVAYRESLRAIVALGDVLWMAVSLCNLGELALEAERPSEAVALLRPAEQALRRLGSVHAAAAAKCLEDALAQAPADPGEACSFPWREALIAAARDASER